MKRVLSIFLVLILVFAMSTSVVMAEPESQAEVSAMPEEPADYDESSLKTCFVFDFTNPESVVYSLCTTGEDSALDYQVELSKYHGQEVKEIECNGERALVALEEEVDIKELNYKLLNYFGGAISFAMVNEEKVFADVSNYVISSEMVTMSNVEEGEEVLETIVKFGNEEQNFKFVSGGESAFMVTKYSINWVNVLIAVMCLAVLILLVFITVLSKKKKNSQCLEDIENPEENALENAEEVNVNEDAVDTEIIQQEEIIEETENAEIVEEITETEANEEI